VELDLRIELLLLVAGLAVGEMEQQESGEEAQEQQVLIFHLDMEVLGALKLLVVWRGH